RALLRLHRPDEAHEAARQAAFHEEAGIETLRIHGEAFLLEGDAAAAVAAFRELTHLLPGSSADFRDLGVALRLAGDLDRASEAFRAALDRDPEYVAARIDLAGVLMEAGRIEDSTHECEAALEMIPGYPDGVMLLAEMRRRQGRFDGAIGLLVDLLSRDAYHLAGLFELGRAIAEAGRPDDARHALE